MLFASKDYGHNLFNKRQTMIDKGPTFFFSPTTDFKLGTFQDHFESLLRTDNQQNIKKKTLTQIAKAKKEKEATAMVSATLYETSRSSIW